MRVLARANPAVTPARVGLTAAAAVILVGTWWAYTAAPRLAAEATGGGVLAALAVAYLRLQAAFSRVEADNRLLRAEAAEAWAEASNAAAKEKAEVRATAVLMVDALVAHQTADLQRRLEDAERRASAHLDKATDAGGRVAALTVELEAARAAARQLDATGRFLAAAVQWDLARRSKKAPVVVDGTTLNTDYWWGVVERAAGERWGAARSPAALIQAAEAATRLTEADWRLLAASEYGLSLPRTGGAHV